MINMLLNTIKEKHNLNPIDIKSFSNFKANGMKFEVEAYHAEGLGHVSVMKASGFLGLMKMETVIIVPKEKDLPLYSYDRIYAMGNDVLIVELYDTMSNKVDFSLLDLIKEKYANIAERDPGTHWYDYMKLPQSISKKSKKKQSKIVNLFALEHFEAYLNTETNMLIDSASKVELSKKYVEGLLEHGGPSTDVFVKVFGKEKTENMYKDVLFGINL